MKNINIRGDDGKPKVGSYQHTRNSLSESQIKQIKKRSINSSTDPSKVVTTKHIQDQVPKDI